MLVDGKLNLIIFYLSCLFVFNCKTHEKFNFNFDGNKVLYIESSGVEKILVLFNIDTGENLRLKNVEFNNDEFYSLVNKGHGLVISTLSDKEFYYDIKEQKREEINWSINISPKGLFKGKDDLVLFTNGEEIFYYSLNKSKLVKKVRVGENIINYATINDRIFAVITMSMSNSFEFQKSDLKLFDIVTKEERKTNFFVDWIINWSSNGHYLLVKDSSAIPYLICYPSLKSKKLSGLEQDSILNINPEMFFIDEDLIIFSGEENIENHYYENLFLYSVKNDKIIKRVTSTKFNKKLLGVSH